MVDRTVDIVIVGGGLVGATLLLALSQSGYSTLLVEERSYEQYQANNFNARTLALAPASISILKTLSVWPRLSERATLIHNIHISEQGRFGFSRLEGEYNSPLGAVVEIPDIFQALYPLIPSNQIIAPAKVTAFDAKQGILTINDGEQQSTIQADLVVAADGADSSMRGLCCLPATIKDYNQHAIIANIGLARSHNNWAYERFTSSGPLALLPMTDNRASLVWSLPAHEASSMLAINSRDFLHRLQAAFGYRLGRFTKVGHRSIYPLRQIIMPQQAQWPVVFIGNAAHTLHPVAGQGFNLSLRDVAGLAQQIMSHGLTPSMLTNYTKFRQKDQFCVQKFTDGLVQLFTSRIPGLSFLRGIGLVALDNSSKLKDLLAYYARGYAGQTPDLACGIPLISRDNHE
ncbi:MAG: FAD-dependent monooxygenase [Legionella sp.]